MRTLIAIAALAALVACSQETKTDDTSDTASTDTATTIAPPPPTTVTITEADARTRVEAQGYTNVTGLTQNPDGTWTATGTRDGQTTQLSVGPNGVSVVTTPPATTP